MYYSFLNIKIINRFSIIFILVMIAGINAFSQDATAKNDAVTAYLNTSFPDKINKVTVDDDNIIIQANITGNRQNIYLCELRMFDETRLVSNNYTSATPINALTPNVQIRLKRKATAGNAEYDRLYSRWVIATKSANGYKALSYAHYADDIADAAKQYLPEEKPRGKKGLEGFFQESREEDLKDLDIKNVTVNITLPQVISLESTQYSYKFDGKTFYMNAKTVEHYDRVFKVCRDNNVFATAIILIQQNIPQNIKALLVHPDANGGVESMANIVSQQGFEYYAAIISFLAERYNRPDKQFGRIQNWIVHNEVDNGIYWTNAGNVKMEVYTELYDRVMRTTYYALRQYNPAAKVFISLTHGWAVAAKPTFYAPKYMLAFFNAMSQKQGDYEWGVAFHPYSQDITNPMPWIDNDTKMDINSTHIITSKNIELLDEWMRTREHLYRGLKVRTLLFSEQGANSKSTGKEDLQMQAAVIAYMWKKCFRLPSVEAFDYHAQCDNKNEHLNFGLWTSKLGTIATPDQKKASWFTYQKVETPAEDDALQFALPIIGVSNWQQVFNTLQKDMLPVTVTFAVTKNGSKVNDASVYFNGEMHKTINGNAIFYNVATSDVTTRYYRVLQNGKVVYTQKLIRISGTKNIAIALN